MWLIASRVKGSWETKAEKLQALGFAGCVGPGVRDAGISCGVGDRGMF